MEVATIAFPITWAVGAVAFWVTAKKTKSLRSVPRLAIRSFVFALFFTPAVFIAHHGIAFCPAVASVFMSLTVWSGLKPVDAVITSAAYILVGWVIAALIGPVSDFLSIIRRSNRTMDPDARKSGARRSL
jgi:hypothetical protein